MYKYFLLLVLLALLATNVDIASADNLNQRLGLNILDKNKYSPSMGLIDPSKLKMNHYASFGVSTGGGSTVASSILGTTALYPLSNSVTMSFLVGLQRNQFVGKDYTDFNTNALRGGVGFEYKMSENTSFSIIIEGVINNFGQGFYDNSRPYGGYGSSFSNLNHNSQSLNR